MRALEVPVASSWAGGVPERVPGTEGLRVGGDFVVLDPEGKVLRGLNASGAAVWELIDARRSLEAIAAEIARRYAVSVARVLEDVISFARALMAGGLLTIRRPAGERG